MTTQPSGKTYTVFSLPFHLSLQLSPNENIAFTSDLQLREATAVTCTCISYAELHPSPARHLVEAAQDCMMTGLLLAVALNKAQKVAVAGFEML